MTSTERKDIRNGIWLCGGCHTIVDRADLAYSVEMLTAWKTAAERTAARDARSPVDRVAAVVAALDDAWETLLDHCASYEQTDPANRVQRADVSFEDHTDQLLGHSQDRRGAYARTVAPKVTAVVQYAEVVLGDIDVHVVNCKKQAAMAPVNYIAMRELAERLQELKSVLALR